MRTEDMLTRAFDTLAGQAPAPDDTRVVLPSGRPPVWRHRLVVAAVAVACLAVIAVPSWYFGVHRVEQTPQPAPPSVAPPVWQQPAFDVALEPGWRLELREVTPERSEIGIGNPATGVGCSLLGYAPGRFPTRLIPAQRVATTVDGKPAVFATIPVTIGSTSPERGEQVLGWQYDPNAWALVYCRHRSPWQPGPAVASVRSWEHQAAAMMRFAPERLRVPIAIEPVDAGPRATAILVERGDAQLSRNRRHPSAYRAGVVLGTGGRTLSVAVWHQRPVDPEYKPGATVVDVDGRRGWTYLLTVDGGYERRGLLVDTGNDTLIEVYALGGPADATEELVALARRVRLAPDLEDERTWYDAADSLP